jgi:colanic acid/amylovoran biosynthesis glycosyltransferase
MLKVAHVIRSYLAQSETFIWQYLHNFKRVTPVVITQHLENLDQFPLTNGHIRLIYGPRGSIPWFIDNCYRRVLNKPFGYMARIMRKEGIRVIHAHFGHVACNYLPVSLSLNIPLVTNFYGYDLSAKDIINQHQEAYVELFKKGKHFLVEGPCMQGKLISLGCPEEKISIQRIAINLENYKFKTRSWDRKRPIHLLFVGRFVEKKGLEYAMRALAKIRKDYSFQFRIIGGGGLEQSLRLLSSNLGLTKEIAWLGVQPHRKVIEELQTCDILIQPSVTAKNGDSEGGAPTIILEAQACGVPVIATTHADIPYITCPNESALLSPERDVDSLTHNICQLFDNSEAWSRMGKKGREHVEKYHDVKKEVAALEAIYTELLSGTS